MPTPAPAQKPRAQWRNDLLRIIFEADTPVGKAFDVLLLIVIVASVLIVLLGSVDAIEAEWEREFYALEWVFTAIFTLEYIVRLICVPRAGVYAVSFFGIVDLMALLPSYLSLLMPGAQSLLVIRALRLLRLFRIFKLGRFVGEGHMLMHALRASRIKITVFLITVAIIVVIMGALMWLIEGHESGFTSIPRGMYWAIVTMTTVGYGDITPQTIPGQVFAALLMILGYGIIAVPTGIVTSELLEVSRNPVTTRICPACLTEGHEHDARYCKDCGAQLEV